MVIFLQVDSLDSVFAASLSLNMICSFVISLHIFTTLNKECCLPVVINCNQPPEKPDRKTCIWTEIHLNWLHSLLNLHWATTVVLPPSKPQYSWLHMVGSQPSPNTRSPGRAGSRRCIGDTRASHSYPNLQFPWQPSWKKIFPHLFPFLRALVSNLEQNIYFCRNTLSFMIKMHTAQTQFYWPTPADNPGRKIRKMPTLPQMMCGSILSSVS